MKCQVYLNELKAALCFASEDETRAVLCGIHLESTADKLIAVGCDGRRIVAVQSLCPQTEIVPGCAIINRDALKLVFRIFKQEGGLQLETSGEDSPAKQWLQINQGALRLEIRNGCVEGNYPKWRMIIPRKNAKRNPVHGISLNPLFVGKLSEAAKLLGWKSSAARFFFVDAEAVVIAQIPDLPNVWAAIMPARDPYSDGVLWEPEWLDLPLLVEKQNLTSTNDSPVAKPTAD